LRVTNFPVSLKPVCIPLLDHFIVGRGEDMVSRYWPDVNVDCDEVIFYDSISNGPTYPLD